MALLGRISSGFGRVRWACMARSHFLWRGSDRAYYDIRDCDIVLAEPSPHAWQTSQAVAGKTLRALVGWIFFPSLGKSSGYPLRPPSLDFAVQIPAYKRRHPQKLVTSCLSLCAPNMWSQLPLLVIVLTTLAYPCTILTLLLTSLCAWWSLYAYRESGGRQRYSHRDSVSSILHWALPSSNEMLHPTTSVKFETGNYKIIPILFATCLTYTEIHFCKEWCKPLTPKWPWVQKRSGKVY